MFDTEGYGDLEVRIDEILNNACALLPKMKECKLKRIDFCENLCFENQQQVKTYIKILKRGNIPSKLKIFEFYDHTTKRTKPSKHDHTVYAGKHFELTIYDKQKEMASQKKGVFHRSEIDNAEGIVRVEARSKEGKVKELKKKYGIETISQFMYCADIIGWKVFSYYLGKMYNKGDFYCLKDALDNIDNSGYRKKDNQTTKRVCD